RTALLLLELFGAARRVTERELHVGREGIGDVDDGLSVERSSRLANHRVQSAERNGEDDELPPLGGLFRIRFRAGARVVPRATQPALQRRADVAAPDDRDSLGHASLRPRAYTTRAPRGNERIPSCLRASP